MKYRIEETTGEVGGDRVFLRVSFWYDGNDSEEPDTEGEFLIHPGPEVITDIVFNELGNMCKTVSGGWAPPWREDASTGEWVKDLEGPEDDPFLRVVVAEDFPLLRQIISNVGKNYQSENRKKADHFKPGQIMKDIEKVFDRKRPIKRIKDKFEGKERVVE